VEEVEANVSITRPQRAAWGNLKFKYGVAIRLAMAWLSQIEVRLKMA
jgi:hypothetical protein